MSDDQTKSPEEASSNESLAPHVDSFVSVLCSFFSQQSNDRRGAEVSSTREEGTEDAAGKLAAGKLKLPNRMEAKSINCLLTKKWNLLLTSSASAIAVLISIATLLGVFLQIHHLTEDLEQRKAAIAKANIHSAENITKRPQELLQDRALLEREIEILQLQLATMEETLKNFIANKTYEQGSTYIHWGRGECQGDATTIYSGFGGGSPTEEPVLPGGGVQYLCLPNEPEWNKFDMSNDTLAFGWVYGAKYMTGTTTVYDKDLHGQNVICSVCHSPRPAKLMIPAVRTCPDTWTKEYEGYLMSSYVYNSRSTFECLDEHPTMTNETDAVTGGSLLYHISGRCHGKGSLQHCPPYVHARELTCAVCTK